MLSQTELTALQQNISNDARVLYLLGLRIDADKTTGLSQPVEYKHLRDLLNAKQPQYKLGRQINVLFKELLHAGLISVAEATPLSHSINGQQVLLPLLINRQDDYDSLHMQWCAMHLDWQPVFSVYQDLSKLVGLLDQHYASTDLGDFIAYWMSRPQMQFSQFQWTQKFVFHLKHKRSSGTIVNNSRSQRVGGQWIQPTASLEADENSKKLVQQYKQTSKKNGK